MKDVLKSELMAKVAETAGNDTETKRNALAWVEELFDGMGLTGTISGRMMERYISILESTKAGLSAGSDGYEVIDGAIRAARGMAAEV